LEAKQQRQAELDKQAEIDRAQSQCQGAGRNGQSRRPAAGYR